MSKQRVGIKGVGYHLPSQIRTNDDPIFDWLKKHDPEGTKLFSGYKTRHILSEGETVTDIMLPACTQALTDAGIEAKDVDMVLGYTSVSDFVMPNELGRLHCELRLRSDCPIIPVHNEYANFNTSVMLANDLIQAGRIRNALIACGSNWTRYVDYHTPQSVSAADGAGAAVVGLDATEDQFRFVDSKDVVESQYFGTMYMRGQQVHEKTPEGERLFLSPTFQITTEGLKGFKEFGMKAPVKVVEDVLTANNLVIDDVCLIIHQTSLSLMRAWQDKLHLPDAQMLQTLSQFANMVHASIPVNLAYFKRKIPTDHVIFLALSPEMSTNATLVRRRG